MKNEGKGEKYSVFNPLNAELNVICHMLALLGSHPIFHVSRVRVNLSHNSSVDLRLETHFESNVISASTSITTMYFALRVVSAEFHTNRSEARQ